MTFLAVATGPVLKGTDPEILDIIPKLCFAEGTLVDTKNGLVPIEKVRVGDAVLTRNMASGKLEYKKVSALVEPHLSHLIEVRFANERRAIRPSPEHPFFLRHANADSGNWVTASEIKSGDSVLTAKGTWSKVLSATPLEKEQTVYNFEVEDNHDYFVGTSELLVHNVCNPSRTLGSNLEKAGFKRADGDEAHHIVPVGDKRAAPAQAVLERMGIDINDADNGAFLPRDIHQGTFGQDYIDTINEEITAAEPGGPDAVRDALNDLRDLMMKQY